MSKSKKHKRKSESEDSLASSSSDSSSEASSSEEDTKKKRKIKKSKSKRRRKKSTSSSSSSSSSESDDDSDSSDSTGSSDNEKMCKKKKKDAHELKSKEINKSVDSKQRHEPEKRVEHKHQILKEEEQKRGIPEPQNRSKWDSPSKDHEENIKDKYKHRQWEHDRENERDYHDNSRYRNNWRNNNRGRRYEGERGNRRIDRRHNNKRQRNDYDQSYKRDYNRDSGRQREHNNNHRESNNRSPDRRHNYRDDRDRRDNRDKRRSRSPHRPRNFRRRSNDENRAYKWGKEEDEDKKPEKIEEKEKPNFSLSGKLTEDTNKVNGVIIKYAEPPEARKPKRRWRLYPFKGERALPTLYIHRQSCYLIGRDRKVCDLPVDHPSCSKQHAALQYRLVPFDREDGTVGKRVRPYLIDLESANGTFLNNKKIESKKYIELLEKDVIKFGFSSREYVLLHENSKEDQQDDDVVGEEIEIKEEPGD